MELDLANQVSMQQSQSLKEASISQIRLLQSPGTPVIVRAQQRDLTGKIVSRHEMVARQIHLVPSDSGQVVASGPGAYRGWIYGKRAQSLSSRFAKTNPNSNPIDSVASDNQDEMTLNGVHLTFHRAMQADLSSKVLSFVGGVRAGMRELENWEQIVDVRQMDRLAVGESTLDCRDLRFGISPGLSPRLKAIPGYPVPWEVEAVGGVYRRDVL